MPEANAHKSRGTARHGSVRASTCEHMGAHTCDAHPMMLFPTQTSILPQTSILSCRTPVPLRVGRILICVHTTNKDCLLLLLLLLLLSPAPQYPRCSTRSCCQLSRPASGACTCLLSIIATACGATSALPGGCRAVNLAHSVERGRHAMLRFPATALNLAIPLPRHVLAVSQSPYLASALQGLCRRRRRRRLTWFFCMNWCVRAWRAAAACSMTHAESEHAVR